MARYERLNNQESREHAVEISKITKTFMARYIGMEIDYKLSKRIQKELSEEIINYLQSNAIVQNSSGFYRETY